MTTPPKQSYLSAGLGSFSPWSSRSATPVQKGGPQGRSEETTGANSTNPALPGTSTEGSSGLGKQRGGDHAVRMRQRHYSPEVPYAEVRWFHAVDTPKFKPVLSNGQATLERVQRPPKKFVPFSSRDSRAIESAFDRWSEKDEAAERERNQQSIEGRAASAKDLNQPKENRETVPVNEDYLFDVDVFERELKPAYWNGLVYEVRRGLWFNSDGSVTDENLSTQLEDGFLKIKPWKFPSSGQSAGQPDTSKSRSRPPSLNPNEAQDYSRSIKSALNRTATPQSSSENLKAPPTPNQPSLSSENFDGSESDAQYNRTYRLFGQYMNCVVTYQDSTTAWLLTDDFLSKLSSNMYQRFAGGGHFAGVKLTRGYSDTAKKSETKDGRSRSETVTSSKGKTSPHSDSLAYEESDESDSSPEIDKRRRTLERQMSSLVSAHPEDKAKEEEEVRKREEQEIQDDYREDDNDEQDRPIEHLLLITHGIGQRLGMRMESINFIHDVNTLRKTLKSVYTNSADLQALNNEVERLPKNCRIQVLPVVWRHRLDFPKQSLKHNRQELDLGDATAAEDEEYPSLDDITVDGVPAVRNLITDLALDVLLYQSPAYKGHISRIVVEESNRIFHQFKRRNPSFNGRVSLVGHSLGSAIMFDLLCRSKLDRQRLGSLRKGRKTTEKRQGFDFEVDDFYALGSPIGLFQMLKGRTVAARESLRSPPAETPDDEGPDDPFYASAKAAAADLTVSSPNCQRIFNIFHPSDPVAYRIEPLISSAMASLKPQPLPYTKRGIFGAPVGQGLTGIGARVGQSISGMWSGFSTGIASSLLNRSLGLTAEDAKRMGNNTNVSQQARGPLSPHAITQSQPQELQPASADPALGTNQVKEGEEGPHPPTLIDSEIQTLYSGFTQRQRDGTSDEGTGSDTGGDDLASEERQELEFQSRRLKREEGKVRALNANGRVDYSIQEGAFDISLIASIASHLSYWGDEDVVHFMISQLLARHRVMQQRKSTEDMRNPSMRQGHSS